jgi:hypothetical protein
MAADRSNSQSGSSALVAAVAAASLDRAHTLTVGAEPYCPLVALAWVPGMVLVAEKAVAGWACQFQLQFRLYNYLAGASSVAPVDLGGRVALGRLDIVAAVQTASEQWLIDEVRRARLKNLPLRLVS